MNIIHSITIKTTPERLYDAVTTQSGIAGWWTPKTKAEPKVGAIVELTFDAFVMSYRVEKLDLHRRAVWSGVQVPPDWKSSHLTFEIVPKGTSVEFTFTQSGLPTPYEDFGFFNYCWGQYVRSLKLLLETGKGEPYGTPAANAWHPLHD